LNLIFLNASLSLMTTVAVLKSKGIIGFAQAGKTGAEGLGHGISAGSPQRGKTGITYRLSGRSDDRTRGFLTKKTGSLWTEIWKSGKGKERRGRKTTSTGKNRRRLFLIA